jgi:hypothetical protein
MFAAFRRRSAAHRRRREKKSIRRVGVDASDAGVVKVAAV